MITAEVFDPEGLTTEAVDPLDSATHVSVSVSNKQIWDAGVDEQGGRLQYRYAGRFNGGVGSANSASKRSPRRRRTPRSRILCTRRSDG
jgi:hypothetical protein